MALIQVVENLASLRNDLTIYAAEPWTQDSEVMLLQHPEARDVSNTQLKGKPIYFLEVSIAQEFLEDWSSALGRKPSVSEKCARLIKYAINDA